MPPIIHEPVAGDVFVSAVGEIEGECIDVGEVLKIAGKAGVAGVAPAENDARGRKQESDEAEAINVAWQLVNDEPRLRILGPQVLKMLTRNLFYGVRSEKEGIGFKVSSLEASGDFENGTAFAGAANGRMTDGDLLDQGGAGARHADDEDWNFRGFAPAAPLLEEFG